MRCRITISVALAMWAGWGCAGEETPTQVVPPEHAQVSTAGAADWAKPAGPDDVVVATVQGVPITREMVLAVQEASPGLDARGALERLIDLEVLAQRARQLGLDEAVRVREARRQGLVQRFLRKGFEPEVTPETLPLEQAKELYYVPDVRKLYDHTDAWRMAHIFFTCCGRKMFIYTFRSWSRFKSKYN